VRQECRAEARRYVNRDSNADCRMGVEFDVYFQLVIREGLSVDKHTGSGVVSRRGFMATTGSMLAASPVLGGLASKSVGAGESASATEKAARRIPIGVFDVVYDDLPLDEMIEKISGQGMEAVEIGTGGYSKGVHCPLIDLLADPAKANAWKKKFEDRNILVGALSCHGNPLHPVTETARRFDDAFRRTVLLAERLEIPVVVGFSGCPGDSPSAKRPNWITYRWPHEYDEVVTWQWEKVVIPYWREAAKFAREHGIRRIALEMHPNFVVYNPQTLLRLRGAVGEEIGANCDLSHLFWQGCDPVEVIHDLGKQGAIYHAHMKDTVVFKENAARTGVLNFSSDPAKVAEGSVIFRAVGYGHGAQAWKEIVKAYMDIGYQGMMSIEHEDSLLSGEVGVERSAFVLKNVRAELLEGK